MGLGLELARWRTEGQRDELLGVREGVDGRLVGQLAQRLAHVVLEEVVPRRGPLPPLDPHGATACERAHEEAKPRGSAVCVQGRLEQEGGEGDGPKEHAQLDAPYNQLAEHA